MSAQQLTIILTLKDRVDFSLRWMNYMNDIRCPYKILVADGGKDSFLEEYLENQNNYPNLDYVYYRYPYDLNLDFFYKKLLDIIEKVATPYVLFADNDDFYLIDHFPASIDFLNKFSDFVSCGGEHVEFKLLSKNNEIVNSPYGRNYIAYSFNKLQSIDFDLAVDRVTYFLENVERQMLWLNWYNIHRVSAVKQGFEILKEYRITEVVVMELHFHMTLLTIGKYSRLKNQYYFRQNGTSQITGALNKEMKLFERFIVNNSYNEVLKSINSLALNDGQKKILTSSYLKWFAELAITMIPELPKGIITRFIRSRLRKTNSFLIFYCSKLLKQVFLNRFKRERVSYIRLPYLQKYFLDDKEI